MALGLVLAVGIGAALGVLGAGGAIVTVPVLVYVVGLEAPQAAATSLLVVGLVAAVGVATRWRSVRLRSGLVFGLAGMLGVLPGVWLNHRVAPAVVGATFGGLMLFAALRLLRQGQGAPPARGPHPLLALGAGAGVGFATGFLGVGGGFLIVPALVLLLGLDLAAAAATSLLVIALNCAAGLAGHGASGAVEWRLGIAFGAVALLGAQMALPFAARLPAAALRRGFAAVLLVLGAGMMAGAVVPS